jgi:hypothetical protein
MAALAGLTARGGSAQDFQEQDLGVDEAEDDRGKDAGHQPVQAAAAAAMLPMAGHAKGWRALLAF